MQIYTFLTIRYAYSLMTRIFYRHNTTRNGFSKSHALIFEYPITQEVENEMIITT